MERDPILVERQTSHGLFSHNAIFWKELCSIFLRAQRCPSNEEQSLAMTMIMLKIARIAQNPGVKDHWDDIAGYAKLGSEACD